MRGVAARGVCSARVFSDAVVGSSRCGVFVAIVMGTNARPLVVVSSA
jgi:hypothetical protein